MGDPNVYKENEKLSKFERQNEEVTRSSKEIASTAKTFMKGMNNNIESTVKKYSDDHTLFTSGGKALHFNFDDEKDTVSIR